jgi:hypothetical protein
VRMRCSMKYSLICRHAHAIFWYLAYRSSCCSSTKLVVWTTDTGIPKDDSDSAVKSWRSSMRKIHSEETYILLCLLLLHSTSKAKYLQVPTTLNIAVSWGHCTRERESVRERE